ncbi:MAG: hypothetical protein AB9888_08215 [Bacteroidales bacterium]
MKLVKNIDDIRVNIKTINVYLKDENLKDYAISLIKRGTCFVAIKEKQGYSFYPSRFIGYINNSQIAHQNNYEKNGRDTNPAINAILNHKPSLSEELEEDYKQYCERLGFKPNKKGAFGAERKYWLLP